jgi:hypothetical protein
MSNATAENTDKFQQFSSARIDSMVLFRFY